MSSSNSRQLSRLAAFAALAGAVTMVIGAVLWQISGVDLDRALAAGTMADYLEATAGRRPFVVANLVAWIIGVLLLGVAGTLLARLCDRRRLTAQVAVLCYWTAVPLAITSFVAMLAIAVQVAPETSAQAIVVSEVVGWFASRADWIATILIVGAGPALLSFAGRGEWVPSWLAAWGVAAAVAGVLTALAMFTDGLSTYGFLIVPVGLGWTIAAGVVVARYRPPEQRL